jgi:hypothetical protein
MGAKMDRGDRAELRTGANRPPSFVMSPTDDIRDLLAVGFISLAGAIAADMLERAIFATIFTFLGAFAISIAITRARDGQ